MTNTLLIHKALNDESQEIKAIPNQEHVHAVIY